jgi:ABC-type antimicrobial peptide transport system permease subunit
MTAPVRPALVAVGVAAGLVLLIASVNVANILLVRDSARRRETDVRLALGAGRSRLIRKSLTESFMLVTLGGLVGTAIAHVAVRVVAAYGPARRIVPLPDP